MKSAHYVLIFLSFIAGGIIFYRSLNQIPRASNAYVEPSITPSPINSTPTAYMLPTETPVPTIPPPSKSPNSKIQVLKATYGPPFGFAPTELTVKAGTPVRLEVYAAENGRGCMGSIALPDFSKEVYGFTKGQTYTYEFTPTTPGTYPITCAMGIPHGFITVK